MSWQGYVDSNLVGTGHLTQAAICGLDGSVWAKSANFNITATEIKAIVAGFADGSSLYANGVRANGVKYTCVRALDDLVAGKSTNGGIVCQKSNQSVIVGVYEGEIQPGNANKVVGQFTDWMKEQGY
ncbi:profilin [Anaeramoeba ignava]|uniref:Profilin n=1 Tax=Anaeramoeba ignava TaxID=1746090 RepID=A0A9Q0LSB0_ANAIG|nr:profilin [Anaeramoeba ignava]|eukprot:Anaeramoba_ignava/a478554_6183.p1 GENE.a478554_6183~~a478554_6183.p1  ORF type:complete len:127 (+),score=44.54 a478554_6183:53-433(+)